MYKRQLAGNAGGFDHRITNNYSTGTIKASNGAKKGQLIGIYSEGDDKASNKIYNNYYTKSGKAYGLGYWVRTRAISPYAVVLQEVTMKRQSIRMSLIKKGIHPG